MDVSIIAAIGENREIGFRNRMPWNIPADLQRFKELTLGHPVIVGQTTYVSILEQLGKPLPRRRMIVLSDDASFSDARIEIARSIPEALEIAWRYDTNAFVAGGASIYRQFLPFATLMYLTHVQGEFQADTYFPEYKPEEWREVLRERHDGFAFVNYERVKPN